MTDTPEMRALPGLGALWAFIGLIAFVLLAFVGIGFALPGTWTVERSREIDAPVEEVFPLVADLENWEQWTHWPELQGRTDGASSGIGASRSWDDPSFGRGELTVTDVAAGERVSYAVVVDDGAIHIEGVLSLQSNGARTTVTWHEEGDFGWNPLLAYMALTMDRMQGTELEKSLGRLSDVATGAPSDPSLP